MAEILDSWTNQGGANGKTMGIDLWDLVTLPGDLVVRQLKL